MVKKWPFVLSASAASVLAGVFLHKKTQQEDHTALYVGTWTFRYPGKDQIHKIEIFDDLAITVDGKSVAYQLIELSADKFVIQDQFGYHLILSTKDGLPYELYDEADDMTMPLQAGIN